MLYRIDGWDYWPSSGGVNNSDIQNSANADGYFNDLTQVVTVTGRFGRGLAMAFLNRQFSGSLEEAIGKRWTTETCVIGQAIQIPATLSGQSVIYSVIDGQGGNGTQFWLAFDDLGVISLNIGGTSSSNSGGGTLVARTPAKTYHAAEWDYAEIKFKIDATAGMVEVRVNKVVVISYVGRTTNTVAPVLSLAPGWDSVAYSRVNLSTGPLIYIDDRYILDNTGANNTDYLGNVRVNLQLAVSAGDLTQMSVHGAASNWDAVNDPLLTEVEYVFDSVMGDTDLYTMDPNVSAQNIFGVQVVGAHRQDDATQLKSNILLKTGGTVFSGADHELAQTYHYYRDLWELNPHTGVGWVASDLNAVQAGQKVLLG